MLSHGVAAFAPRSEYRCVHARNAFLSEAHANFDGSLRRFFARRGIARDEIADLTQEVYLRLARQPDVTSIRSAQAFVFTTAMNLVRDRFRRRATRGIERRLAAETVEIPAEGVDPEKSAECSQQLSAVWKVVGSLKPATQRVFVGHRMHGQSYAELAQELGVSVSMIEKHMISAIGALSPLR
jgi:RNA polymerase sigma factor (sigma-70 family)